MKSVFVDRRLHIRHTRELNGSPKIINQFVTVMAAAECMAGSYQKIQRLISQP
jgi:hypothetical protein